MRGTRTVWQGVEGPAGDEEGGEPMAEDPQPGFSAAAKVYLFSVRQREAGEELSFICKHH